MNKDGETVVLKKGRRYYRNHEADMFPDFCFSIGPRGYNVIKIDKPRFFKSFPDLYCISDSRVLLDPFIHSIIPFSIFTVELESVAG